MTLPEPSGCRRWHLLLDRHNALWAARKEGFAENELPQREFSQYDPMPVRDQFNTDEEEQR